MKKDDKFFDSLQDVMDEMFTGRDLVRDTDVTVERVMMESMERGNPVSYTTAVRMIKRMEQAGKLKSEGKRRSAENGRAISVWVVV